MGSYGLGYRPIHFQNILLEQPKFDFLEIISENFMGVGGSPRKKLEELRHHFPIAMHGVSLSIAGSAPLDRKYLASLKDLIDRVDPFIVSDHICFTTDHHHQKTYDLLPTPYNPKTLIFVSDRVSRVQDFLGRSILLENPSCYLGWASSVMAESDFLKNLCDKTGAGILLDLNNLVVNKYNLGINPSAYFQPLKQHVKQIHIAGHQKQDGAAIDTHDNFVCDEVWELLSTAKNLWPDAPIVLEWDDKFPSFADLCEELQKAKKIDMTNKATDQLPINLYPIMDRVDLVEKNLFKEDYESLKTEKQALTDAIINIHPTHSVESHLFSKEHPLPIERGMQIYQSAYSERIKSTLKETSPILSWIAEEEGISAITQHFLKHKTNSHWSLNFINEYVTDALKQEPLNFNFGVEQDLIAEIARLDSLTNSSFLAEDDFPFNAEGLAVLAPIELENHRFGLTQSTRYFLSNWNLVPLIQEFNLGKDPQIPQKVPRLIVVCRKLDETQIADFDPSFFSSLELVKKVASLPEINPKGESEIFLFFTNLCRIGAVKLIQEDSV